MKGYDVIRELYNGNLHPCDRGYRSDTAFSIALDAFTKQEDWLKKNLTDESCKHLEELISCHNDIVNTMSYENFRTGFQLGAMMVIEATSENTSVLFEL